MNLRELAQILVTLGCLGGFSWDFGIFGGHLGSCLKFSCFRGIMCRFFIILGAF